MFCCLTESVVSSHKLICHFLSKKNKIYVVVSGCPAHTKFIGSLFMHINNQYGREFERRLWKFGIGYYLIHPIKFFCRKKEASWKSWNFKGMCFNALLPLEERNRVEIVRTGPRAILIGCFVINHVELCTRWPACCIPWGPCLVLYNSFFFFFFFFGHLFYFCTINSFGNSIRGTGLNLLFDMWLGVCK